VIVLGSVSPIKAAALLDAMKRANMTSTTMGVAASSGVDEQPIDGMTAIGAQNRAIEALRMCPAADFAVGVESGIFRLFGRWMDHTVVVVQTRVHIEPIAVATSVGIAIPENCVMAAMEAGLDKHTAGRIFADRHGGYPADMTTTLTGGRLTRQGLIGDAVYAALVQAFGGTA
jgi:non-canonical (house-cleaning) NTP pyrophosphatase